MKVNYKSPKHLPNNNERATWGELLQGFEALNYKSGRLRERNNSCSLECCVSTLKFRDMSMDEGSTHEDRGCVVLTFEIAFQLPILLWEFRNRMMDSLPGR